MILNTRSIDTFITTFVEENADWISHLQVDGEWRIGITAEDECFRNSVVNDYEPFGMNRIFHCIAVNTERCLHYELTDEMKTAMLCHEIGHIVYAVDQQFMEDERAYSLRKEIAADQLAVEHGLREALRDGLQRLVDSGDFENDNMLIRIRLLSNH